MQTLNREHNSRENTIYNNNKDYIHKNKFKKKCAKSYTSKILKHSRKILTT